MSRIRFAAGCCDKEVFDRFLESRWLLQSTGSTYTSLVTRTSYITMARARGSDVVQYAGMPFTIQTLSSRVKGRRFRSGLGYLDDGRCEAGPLCLALEEPSI